MVNNVFLLLLYAGHNTLAVVLMRYVRATPGENEFSVKIAVLAAEVGKLLICATVVLLGENCLTDLKMIFFGRGWYKEAPQELVKESRRRDNEIRRKQKTNPQDEEHNYSGSSQTTASQTTGSSSPVSLEGLHDSLFASVCKNVFPVMIPSGLYFVQNMLMFVGIECVSAGVYIVTLQLKTIWAALLSIDEDVIPYRT